MPISFRFRNVTVIDAARPLVPRDRSEFLRDVVGGLAKPAQL